MGGTLHGHDACGGGLRWRLFDAGKRAGAQWWTAAHFPPLASHENEDQEKRY